MDSEEPQFTEEKQDTDRVRDATCIAYCSHAYYNVSLGAQFKQTNNLTI